MVSAPTRRLVIGVAAHPRRDRRRLLRDRRRPGFGDGLYMAFIAVTTVDCGEVRLDMAGHGSCATRARSPPCG